MLELGRVATTDGGPRSSMTIATEDQGTDELFDALDALRARLVGDVGIARRRARVASLLRRLAAASIAGTVDGLAATGPFRRGRRGRRDRRARPLRRGERPALGRDVRSREHEGVRRLAVVHAICAIAALAVLIALRAAAIVVARDGRDQSSWPGPSRGARSLRAGSVPRAAHGIAVTAVSLGAYSVTSGFVEVGFALWVVTAMCLELAAFPRPARGGGFPRGIGRGCKDRRGPHGARHRARRSGIGWRPRS